MSYVICDKCGGYYKLQKGESAEDPQNRRFWDPVNGVYEGFEACQCGGNLTYVKSIPKMPNRNKKYIKCTICGHEQERSLVCSNCGSNFRKNVNHRNKYGYRQSLDQSIENDTFIELRGIKSGILLYFIGKLALIIISYMLSGLFGIVILSEGPNTNLSELSPVISIIISILALISAILPIASGFVAVAKITTKDYLIGIVNGAMVGLVVGVIFAVISLISGSVFVGMYGQENVGTISGLFVLMGGIIYMGVWTAAGGLMAVLVRRYTSLI